MKLLYMNANGTNGNKLEQMIAVYQIAGRKVSVPAHLSDAEAKVEIARRFGLTEQQVDRLDQLENRFNGVNLDFIDQLPTNATPAQLILALKEMRQLVGNMQAMLSFQMMDEAVQLLGQSK